MREAALIYESGLIRSLVTGLRLGRSAPVLDIKKEVTKIIFIPSKKCV